MLQTSEDQDSVPQFHAILFHPSALLINVKSNGMGKSNVKVLSSGSLKYSQWM